MPSDFDIAADKFTGLLMFAANWKHNYFGAAYSTRLRQAIKDVREACDELAVALDKDDAISKEALRMMGIGDDR